jgi:hypothetical protein
MEVMMSVNKGKGTKGRSYDELSGVGTSRAGVTGIKDTLSDLRNEAALDTDYGQEGNLQSADLGQSSGGQSGSVSGEGQQNRQSEEGSWSSGSASPNEQGRPGRQGPGGSNPQGGSGNR